MQVGSAIAANLRRVREEIDQIARRCGRDPSEIQLLAASKTLPPEAIREAYNYGQNLFGENRIQEAEEKMAALSDAKLQWHLIGHLQSNKAKRAVELFDAIQTIDGEKIARKVNEHAGKLSKCMPVFIEVNIGREPQKHGVLPEELPSLVPLIDSLENLDLLGLMTLPPYAEDPENSRIYFRQMKQLLSDINGTRASPLTQLSMGMTHDYPIAIEEGATLLRIGTAIFGPRPM